MKATIRPFITLLLFCLFTLPGVKAIQSETLADAYGKGMIVYLIGNTLADETANETFISIDSRNTLLDAVRGNAHRLATRVGANAKRICRFASTEICSFIKALLRKMSIRTNSLAESHIRIYDAAHSLSWDYACQYYVYGMRRILI